MNIAHYLNQRNIRKIYITAVTLGLIISLAALPLQKVLADTQPPSGTPATVSVDPLPTAQIHGIVYAQVMVGNTVYATGTFSQARPAGVPVGGAGTVTRSNLVAYNITTGALTSFTGNLTGTNAVGKAIAASPDGTKLFVGGTFSAVNGQARANIVGFNLATGALLPGFTSGTNGEVQSLAATNDRVFLGGTFTTAGGQSHPRLAAYSSAGAIISGWSVNVDSTDTTFNRRTVSAMTAVPSLNKLVFGGYFNRVNGQVRYSNAAVDLTSGALDTTWASSSASFPIRMQLKAGAPSNNFTRITSMSTDGSKVFLTGIFDGSAYNDGAFEGRAAINADTGSLTWVNDCYGNTWSAFPINKVLYSVGHPHNCSAAGGYPEIPHRFAIAESTEVQGTSGGPVNAARTNFKGLPRSGPINWYPTLVGTGGFSGEVAYSVTGNANYVALGGDFTTTEGKAQQGLVRYAVASVAPNKVGPAPIAYNQFGIAAAPANSAGQSVVRVYSGADPDNTRLTYKLFRKNSTTPLTTQTLTAFFWQSQSFAFTDTGVAPGTSREYRVEVSDPYGNTRSVTNVTAQDDTEPRVSYFGTGWKAVTNQVDYYPDFGRTQHYTNVNGSGYRYSFYGSGFTILGEKGPNRGTASVGVDGVNVGTLNANATGYYKFQQPVFTKTGLGFGKHTVTVTKTGGGYIDMDAIRVTQDGVVDDNSATGISYRTPTNWTSRQNTPVDYGNGIHYTTVNGEYATVTFSGTQFAIMTEGGTNRGAVNISIDGAAPVAASSYTSANTFQRIIYTKTGLAAGTHTVRITKAGGTYMDIDALFYR